MVEKFKKVKDRFGGIIYLFDYNGEILHIKMDVTSYIETKKCFYYLYKGRV